MHNMLQDDMARGNTDGNDRNPQDFATKVGSKE